MNQAERERLVILEQHQKESTRQMVRLGEVIQSNATVTLEIQKTLAELTGAKKALIWITGVIVTIAGIVTAYLGAHKQ